MRSEQIPQQELFDLIDECDVISFDVFETLVWRIYNTPIDLFKHMEASLRVPGFANTRSQAEVRAREVAQEGGRHEVSLDDIYKQMPVRLHKYKQKEIEVEEDCTRQDAWMYAAYRYAVDKGKRIFFASDMYLPGVVIEKMLQKAGYSSPDRFFLSSITNRPKATGAMFEDIIQHSQVPAHRILHIGDNFHGDWAMANAAGLRTYLYVPAIERYGAIAEPALFDTLASTPHADDPASSLIRGLVAQFNMAEPEADFWERFGYRYGGPIAYAFCAWIKSQTDENEIEAVHFLARDGHVFKEAFDRLYPGLNTTYLYASRRCYLLAALRQVDKKFLDLIANDHLLERYSVPWTFRDILEQLALDDRSLSEAFARQFPRMDEAIKTSEQLTEIRAFFKTHEAGLLSAGKSERETLMNYFRKEGLLSGKIALVDLGWKGTLPRTIKEILKLEKQAFDPLCLYFGTHEHDAQGVEVQSFALEQSRPADSVLNTHDGVVLTEMMFSAPHPSIIGLFESDGNYSPKYRKEDAEKERDRLAAFLSIQKGILRFVDDFKAATKHLPLQIAAPLCVAPLKSVSENISSDDRKHFANQYYVAGLGNVQRYEPVMFTYEENSFGVVSPWPGSLSAESEGIVRLCTGARDAGYQAVPISNEGYLLDRNYLKTGFVVDASQLKFCIALHFDTIKLLDSFYFFTLWNPPEIPIGTPRYPRAVDSYLSYDDFLTAGSRRIARNLKAMTNRPVDDFCDLYTSFSSSVVMAPNLKTPTLFYCGMNWEKVEYGTGARHEGVFKLLDRTGVAKFFGPEKVDAWGGIRPWEGFESYCGPIPFDGHSLLDAIYECGVVLVLSSNDHRRSGMATTRIYEACASGAVIISDDNPFVVEHFHDAALFVDYDIHSPEKTFQQIMKHYRWIDENRDEAMKLAQRAQRIFLEKFTHEGRLQNIFARLDERKAVTAGLLHARSQEETVLVFYFMAQPAFTQDEKAKLRQVLHNVRTQSYESITVAIVCDRRIEHLIRYFCAKEGAGVKFDLISINLVSKTGARLLTEGNALTMASERNPHAYLLFAGPREIWFSDHVTTLKRVLENQPDAIAASAGRAFSEPNGSRKINRFGPLSPNVLAECVDVSPGETLIRAEAESFLDDGAYDILDGLERFALLLLGNLRHKRAIAFSRRVTFAVTGQPAQKSEPIIKRSSQVRFILDLVRYEWEEYQETHGAKGEVSAPGDVVLNLRSEVLARTSEVVAIRADLVDRTRVAENLHKDLLATRAELVERTEELDDVREILVERTGVAEEFHKDLLLTRAELVARTEDLDNVRQDLVDRTIVAENLNNDLLTSRADLVARTEELDNVRRELVDRTIVAENLNKELLATRAELSAQIDGKRKVKSVSG